MLKQIGILVVLLSGCAAQGENDFNDNVITHRWDDNIGGQTSVQQTGGKATGGATTQQATGGQNIVQSTGGRTQTTTTSVSTGGLQGTGGNTSTGGVQITSLVLPTYCYKPNNSILEQVNCNTSARCLTICSGYDMCHLFQTTTICTTVDKSRVCTNSNDICQCTNNSKQLVAC